MKILRNNKAPELPQSSRRRIKNLGIIISDPFKKFWKSPPYPPGIFNWAWDLGLEECPEYHFRVEKDNPKANEHIPEKYWEHTWAVHFITGDDIHKPTKSMITEEQKQRLFKAVSEFIQPGEYLSSWGQIYKGGYYGLERFRRLGFEEVGRRDAILMPQKEPITIPIYKKK